VPSDAPEDVQAEGHETQVKGGGKLTKGTPKRDGSGRGTRKNKGHGGCKDTKKNGQGSNRRP